MVGLDYRRLAQAALNNIRINGSLYQEIHGTNLLGFLLKYPDELLADNLALLLRLGYALELLIETLLHIDPDKIQIVWAIRTEYCLNLIPFILAQKAVVHEYAGQLLADGLGHEHSRHGGINAAGQGAECLAVAYLFLQLLDGSLHKGIHAPVTGALADIVHKVAEHLRALYSVQHLRVELYGIQALCLVLHSRYRAYRSISRNGEALRSLGNIVRVAHPADGIGRYALKQLGTSCLDADISLAVLADRSSLHLAAQKMRHQLGAVADAQHRHAKLEYLCADGCRVRCIHAVRAAGKDDALQVLHGLDFLKAESIWMHLAINIALTHTAGNQLVVLATKVQDNNHFICHYLRSSSIHTNHSWADCLRKSCSVFVCAPKPHRQSLKHQSIISYILVPFQPQILHSVPGRIVVKALHVQMLQHFLLLRTCLEPAPHHLHGHGILPLISIIRNALPDHIPVISLLLQLRHNLPHTVAAVMVEKLKPPPAALLLLDKPFRLQPLNSFLYLILSVALPGQLI